MDTTKADISTAESTPVSEIMTKNPICIDGNLELDRVAELLLREGISGAPVVNDKGTPIGVVSKTDIVQVEHGSKARRSNAKAADIMTPIAFTMPTGAPISQAAALMAFESIHRLPIVDEDGVVVGIVSSIDVLRWIATREGYLLSRRDMRRAAVED
jgi:CBS domain-containing protein